MACAGAISMPSMRKSTAATSPSMRSTRGVTSKRQSPSASATHLSRSALQCDMHAVG